VSRRFRVPLVAALAVASGAGCPVEGADDAGLDAAIEAGLDAAPDAAPDAATDARVEVLPDAVTSDAQGLLDTGDGGPDACPPPTTLCGGGCVDLEADPDHCGVCERACTALPGSVPFCSMGRCVMGLCRPGFGSCDGDRSNGCEVELDTSILHCGRCDRACPEGPNARARCELGACRLDCDEGFVDCEPSLPGCECAATDAAHLGADLDAGP
jgi:hypothetical protein